MFEVICYDYTGEPIDFLVQWDTGTTIEIRDIDLPETPIIHFSNKFSEKSLALRDGVVYKNKTLTSPIPDVLLQEPYMLTVYVYAHEYDKNRGKTTNIAKLPIMAKPKPIGYVEKQTYEGINVLALKATVDTYTDSILNIQKESAALRAVDTKHDSEISSLKTRVSTNEKSITTINGNISNLSTKSQNHDSEISSAKTRISKNETDISGLKSHDAVLDGEVEDLQTVTDDLVKRTSAAEKTISMITGTGEGSISKKINDTFNDFCTRVTDDGVVNTYKELIDYAATHAPETANMAADISKNTKDISALEAYVGTIPEGNSATCMVDYVDAKVAAETTRATNVESAANTRFGNAESRIGTNETDISDIRENITALEADAAKKVDNYGWSGNLFLGTDSNGNVITRDALTIVDTVLSTTSTNPIENKAVTKETELIHSITDSITETTEIIRADLDKLGESFDLAKDDLGKLNSDFSDFTNNISNDYYDKLTSDANYAAKSSEHKHDNIDALSSITMDQVTAWNSMINGVSDSMLTSILNAIYPIDSVYVSASESDPSSIFGGTWEQINEENLTFCYMWKRLTLA